VYHIPGRLCWKITLLPQTITFRVHIWASERHPQGCSGVATQSTKRLLPERHSQGCSGVATQSTKRLLPERHPQASGPLAQVYRIPGRLCWKVTISVSEIKSMVFFYLRIIIHICPLLVIRVLKKETIFLRRKGHLRIVRLIIDIETGMSPVMPLETVVDITHTNNKNYCQFK
jgi:hypothetical protein